MCDNHSHEHEHTHEHGHDHSCCGGEHKAQSAVENMALLNYMIDHNRHHNEDLHELFHSLEAADHNMIYVKEDVGAFVSKPTTPPIILAIDETNMNASFWDYLTIIIGNESLSLQGREETYKKLTAYIDRLKENIVLEKAVFAGQ